MGEVMSNTALVSSTYASEYALVRQHTSSTAVVDAPTIFSSSPTRLSISAMSLTDSVASPFALCVVADVALSVSLSSALFSGSSFSLTAVPGVSCTTTFTNRLLPSLSFPIFSKRDFASTMSRISSVASAPSVSTGAVEASASSNASSAFRRRRRCETELAEFEDRVCAYSGSGEERPDDVGEGG